MSTCKCGKPTRDEAYFCDDCGQSLSIALGDVAWLDEELQTTITRTKGVDYRRVGGVSHAPVPERWKGERPDLGVHVQPIMGNSRASDLRTNLHGFLIAWVAYCETNNVRHSSPILGPPPGDIPTMTALSRYLLWRVDGLALTENGSAAVEQITKAVENGKRIIDNPPERWYAGICSAQTDDGPCPEELFARSKKGALQCRLCGTVHDVSQRRDYLLAEAEHVNATASEIAAALLSWTDYAGSETKLVDRIRKWAEGKGDKPARLLIRGHITVRGRQRPLYRLGDVRELLVGDVRHAQEKHLGDVRDGSAA